MDRRLRDRASGGALAALDWAAGGLAGWVVVGWWREGALTTEKLLLTGLAAAVLALARTALVAAAAGWPQARPRNSRTVSGEARAPRARDMTAFGRDCLCWALTWLVGLAGIVVACAAWLTDRILEGAFGLPEGVLFGLLTAGCVVWLGGFRTGALIGALRRRASDDGGRE